MQHLLEQGIATRRGIMLAHREKSFIQIADDRPLHVSEHASDSSVLLPLYPTMTPAEQTDVLVELGA
jgi:dTDP-4-amino-4,6-dideoxygalactose transaminase